MQQNAFPNDGGREGCAHLEARVEVALRAHKDIRRCPRAPQGLVGKATAVAALWRVITDPLPSASGPHGTRAAERVRGETRP